MKNIKILFVSDSPSKALWDHFEPSRLEGIQLIVSCGDLPPQYLSFLATFFNGPVLYVPGNHDDCYLDTPPEGCISIDNKVYEFEGIRIGGLGGSMRYRPGAFQYTEREMAWRALQLRRRAFRHGGLDILVTHAPAWGLGDGEDLPHRGFSCFLPLLKKCHPKYFVHGHMHLPYNYRLKRISEYDGINTTVINAYERYVLEYPNPTAF